MTTEHQKPSGGDDAKPLGTGAPNGTVREVFAAFLKLGLTSFGGPVAHLGYFQAEFVGRRRWVDGATYADFVALSQFLPGPSSSQVGLALGMRRAGFCGGLAAWCGFTLPSAIALALFAYGIGYLGAVSNAAWLHGLKIVAVAIVAQAVWSMATTLCPDRQRVTLAIFAAVLALLFPTALGQVGAIAFGALVGRLFLPTPPIMAVGAVGRTFDKRIAIASLTLFAVLLIGLPILAVLTGNHALDLAARFYRSGSLVFGGGHVVLPVLQQEVVPSGFIGNDAFVAGYGAAQAVPGPLFTFAAYLGARMSPAPSGWLGAAICLVAIYLPSFLLLIGVLPFWDGLRTRNDVRAAMAGVNAAVVGLLLAAFYTPVWTTAIQLPRDVAIGVSAFTLLVFWRWPPWLVVIFGAVAAAALS